MSGDVGWFEWATGTSYEDAAAAAKQGAATGVCQGLFNAGICGWPTDVLSAEEVKAQDEAARAAEAQGQTYCDRTTVLGRAGFCEASNALSSVADFFTSPVVTLAVGTVAVGAVTLAGLAVSNAVGLTPVLQAGGRAAAAGIRGATRAVGGGR